MQIKRGGFGKDCDFELNSIRTVSLANMKFGRNLSQFTVPEWSGSYIKYKALKKLIKSAAEQIKAGQDPDLAGKFDAALL